MDRFKAFRDCFLFQRSSAEMSRERKIWFWVWNWGLVTLSALALGVLALLLACGTRSYAVFYGYFRSPWILALNLLPPLVLMLALYAATSRGWIAWLITSAATLVPVLVNYFKLYFRDDPFTAADILLAREGMAILGNYSIRFGARAWLCVLAIPLGTLALALLARGRLPWQPRIAVLAALLLAAYPLARCYTSETIYQERTYNYDFLTEKRATDRFVGKGFWYPFLHSINDLYRPEEQPPQQPAVEITDGESTLTVQPVAPVEQPDEPEPPAKTVYTTEDIPEEKKIDVVMIMLEAFSDLDRLNIEGISEDVYAGWHALEEESYHGYLRTNIFAAGTVDTERCVLTGDFWVPKDGYTQDAGSYVRYLAGQGYTVTGSHPIYEWFYNRGSINEYLGFESYDFWESRYQTMVDDIAEYLYRDDLFLSDVFELYLKGTGRELVRTEIIEEVPVTQPVAVPVTPPATEPPVEPEPVELPAVEPDTGAAADSLPEDASTNEPANDPAELPTEPVEPEPPVEQADPVEPVEPASLPTEEPEPEKPAVITTMVPQVVGYEEHIEPVEGAERKPYFGFHVTYQGHATYSETGLAWGDGHYTAPEGVSSETYYILNNYLGSVKNTIRELTKLKERLAAQEEPVVLVLFGDHMPWLGYGKSVYHELGINLDTDTEEGFHNYYTTPYLIWANEAAKELLDNDVTGAGPEISPAYLMNELFGLCGWDGPAYMQLMNDLKQTLPVVNTDGYYVEGAAFTESLSDPAQKALDSVRQVADFRRTHTDDMTIVTEALP